MRRGAPRLRNPVFVIADDKRVMLTQFIAAVAVRSPGPVGASLLAAQDHGSTAPGILVTGW